MRIDSKFRNLLEEVSSKLASGDESLTGLELKMLSPEELWDTGFIRKNINSLNPQDVPFTSEEYEEVFNEKCAGLPKEYFGDIIRSVVMIPETMGEFVDAYRKEAVTRYYECKLFEFLNHKKK